MNGEADAVLFDLFGTLISVSKAAKGHGRYTADILGIDRKQWNAACFSAHHEICKPTNQREIIRKLAHSIDPGIPFSLIEEAAEERQWRFDNALVEIEPEILEVLEELKGDGKRLGLISNASTDEIRAWTDSPLRPLFDTALFSCECGIQKPAPQIYRLTLDALEMGADRSLFVGDGGSSEHVGASNAGVRSLLVTYFLDGLTDDELAARAEGSSGTISHIRELSS